MVARDYDPWEAARPGLHAIEVDDARTEDELRKRAGQLYGVASAWTTLHSRTFGSGGKRIACQQFALNCRNLSVDHSKQVELTAACEGEVLHRVCNCFGMR